MKELAELLVECENFRWCRGMDETERGLPNLNDPATIGCLLALVRECHNNPYIHAQPIMHLEGHLWAVWCWDSSKTKRIRLICKEATEAQALVVALYLSVQD